MTESGRDPDAERHDADDRADVGTGVERDPGADVDSAVESETEDDAVEVGDNRQKYVEIVERSGERTEHVQVYLRHATDEFVVSSDDDFPPTETTRYPKTDLLRVEVAQQHSTCFITTATVGESDTLDVLRGFRDDVLRRTRGGDSLVGLYERVSPPVARTLSRHPTARTTELVRWLVTRSAALERRRREAGSRPYRGVLALVLVGVYLLGVCCALCGHGVIRLGERFGRLAPVEGNTDTNVRTNTEP